MKSRCPRYNSSFTGTETTAFSEPAAPAPGLGRTDKVLDLLDSVWSIAVVVPGGVLVFLQCRDSGPLTHKRLVPELHRCHGGVHAQDLVLDALAALDREAQDLFDLLGGGLLVRVEQLHQTGEGLVDAVSVASGDVRSECVVLLVTIGVVEISHRLEDFGNVVDDETVTAGEHLAADRVDFPTRDVEMQAVEVGRVMVTLGGARRRGLSA